MIKKKILRNSAEFFEFCWKFAEFYGILQYTYSGIQRNSMETQDLRYREVDVGESPETRAKIEKIRSEQLKN